MKHRHNGVDNTVLDTDELQRQVLGDGIFAACFQRKRFVRHRELALAFNLLFNQFSRVRGCDDRAVIAVGKFLYCTDVVKVTVRTNDRFDRPFDRVHHGVVGDCTNLDQIQRVHILHFYIVVP